MTCPKCGSPVDVPRDDCPRCGVVFGKLRRPPAVASVVTAQKPSAHSTAERSRRLVPNAIVAALIVAAVIVAALIVAVIAWNHVQPAIAHGLRSALPRSSALGSDWFHGASGYGAAMSDQANSNRSVLLYFYTDWCSYCHKLEEGFLASAEFRDQLRPFIKVKVNPELGDAERQLARTYEITGYPTVFVIDKGLSPRRVPNYREPKDFSSALAGNYPNDALASGFSLLNRGNSDDAQAAFHRASREKPNDPEPHYWNGVALQKRGQTTMATLEFQKAVAIKPHVPSYDYLAWIALKKGDWPEAERYATKLIELDPAYEKGRGYELRGRAYAALGKDFEASRDFSEACSRGNSDACRAAGRP